MARGLEAALSGRPWTVQEVVHGLDDITDDEGRPVAERRAPSASKRNVPMVLRACPYADERYGMPMNLSALAQISRHFEEVLDDVARFRALAMFRMPSWESMLEAALDQLASPAVFLLRGRLARGPIPSRLAVGHKLAAGFFGALRGLLRARALGDRRAVSVEAFLAWVEESRALVGASEACAGPPSMIARAAGALLTARGREAARDRTRAIIAQHLRAQVQIGAAWEMLDRAAEADLLVAGRFEAIAAPRNAFFSRRVTARASDLGRVDAHALLAGAHAALPDDFPDVMQPQGETAALAGAEEALDEWLARSEGAVVVRCRDDRRGLARRFADYLASLVAFTSASCEIERALRRAVGLDEAAPLGNPLPNPAALAWFEAAAGCRVECAPASRPSVVLASHRRRVALA